ncbi:hypothetical protein DUNSADRAFT_11902, partial [Dunaliella salina]
SRSSPPAAATATAAAGTAAPAAAAAAARFAAAGAAGDGQEDHSVGDREDDSVDYSGDGPENDGVDGSLAPHSLLSGQPGISVRAVRLTTKKWRLALAAVAAPRPPLDDAHLKPGARKSNHLSVPAPLSDDGSPARFGQSTMRRRLAHRLLLELDKHGMAYMVASPGSARALAVRCVATVNGWLGGGNGDPSLKGARKAGGSSRAATTTNTSHNTTSSTSTSSSSRRKGVQGVASRSRRNRLAQSQSHRSRQPAAGGRGSRQRGLAVFAAEEIQEAKPDGTHLPLLLLTVLLM